MSPMVQRKRDREGTNRAKEANRASMQVQADPRDQVTAMHQIRSGGGESATACMYHITWHPPDAHPTRCSATCRRGLPPDGCPHPHCERVVWTRQHIECQSAGGVHCSFGAADCPYGKHVTMSEPMQP